MYIYLQAKLDYIINCWEYTGEEDARDIFYIEYILSERILSWYEQINRETADSGWLVARICVPRETKTETAVRYRATRKRDPPNDFVTREWFWRDLRLTKLLLVPPFLKTFPPLFDILPHYSCDFL